MNRTYRKSIVFFDGDGTIWYPSRTKYKQRPDWVYLDPRTRWNPKKHLELTPFAKETLVALKEQGLLLGLLSASPRQPAHANRVLRKKVAHFGLDGLFDEVHATQRYQACKGDYIAKILEQRGIAKQRALMVGDSYDWDYQSARWQGVDALLIKSHYQKAHPKGRQVRRTIARLKDVLNHV
jgi:FMN phosphatase YigB (HAD superfamily)